MYPGFLNKHSNELFRDLCNEVIHQVGVQNDIFSRKILEMFIVKFRLSIYDFIMYSEDELKMYAGIEDDIIKDLIALQNKIKLHYKL